MQLLYADGKNTQDWMQVHSFVRVIAQIKSQHLESAGLQNESSCRPTYSHSIFGVNPSTSLKVITFALNTVYGSGFGGFENLMHPVWK